MVVAATGAGSGLTAGEAAQAASKHSETEAKVGAPKIIAQQYTAPVKEQGSWHAGPLPMSPGKVVPRTGN